MVVSELTLAATRDTIRILSWLKSNAPQTKVDRGRQPRPERRRAEISKKDFEQSIERKVDIVFPYDRKVAAQAAKLGKPIAEIATGKMAAPFTQLSNMVLSHASEEGAVRGQAGRGGGKSLVDNLKSMLAKPKDKAALIGMTGRAGTAALSGRFDGQDERMDHDLHHPIGDRRAGACSCSVPRRLAVRTPRKSAQAAAWS